MVSTWVKIHLLSKEISSCYSCLCLCCFNINKQLDIVGGLFDDVVLVAGAPVGSQDSHGHDGENQGEDNSLNI